MYNSLVRENLLYVDLSFANLSMNGFIWHWHHIHCNAGFHDFYSKTFDFIYCRLFW